MMYVLFQLFYSYLFDPIHFIPFLSARPGYWIMFRDQVDLTIFQKLYIHVESHGGG